MLKKSPSADLRSLHTRQLRADLAVVGGGLAGVCCAITAARAGLRVVLIQDRPLLGGNASSEVRLWVLGATSHMGNNNRWAREGGVIDEILVENVYRNPEGNPLMVDTLLLEKVACEPNIILLLNTAVHDLEKSDADTINWVRAFCSQNSTAYEITAPLFCDASGDGIVGFLAGAAFRMGSEAKSEFGEKWAPEKPASDLLGLSIYFYSKDTGRPVQFVPPSFALKDIQQIPHWRDFRTQEFACRLWWIEWGGNLDTVHETETIKWELWKVVYGVWNHIKNSGRFPEAETLTLEWVGMIPGKRESRRFEGDYILIQQDVVEQRQHADAVSFGGWAIDLHPAEGVFSEQPGCTQWHSKGVYQIPYRCLYSRNITNLFLAGRIISASHIAFGSTRVMATAAHGGQAAGMAAALCLKHKLKPRDLAAAPRIVELQRALLRAGQHIPGVALEDPHDLAPRAELSASSELRLGELKPNGETLLLKSSTAMMLPVQAGPMPTVTYSVDAAQATTLHAELRVSSKPDNHTPDVTLAQVNVPIKHGTMQPVELCFKTNIDEPRYAFICLMANDAVSVHLSNQRLTGVLALGHNGNKAVAKSSTQTPPPGTGIETFEFWLPQRRPAGKNFALKVSPPLEVFGCANLVNGIDRPTRQPNAWVAAFDEPRASLTLHWEEPQRIARVELAFDTDYDHPMETVLLGHPERVMPFCVRRFQVWDAATRPSKSEPVKAVPALIAGKVAPGRSLSGFDSGENGKAGQREAAGTKPLRNAPEEPERLLAEVQDNHESRRVIRLDPPITTDCVEIVLAAPSDDVPPALFEVRCYDR